MRTLFIAIASGSLLSLIACQGLHRGPVSGSGSVSAPDPGLRAGSAYPLPENRQEAQNRQDGLTVRDGGNDHGATPRD